MIFKVNNDWGNTKITSGVSGVKAFVNNIKSSYFTPQQRFSAEDTQAIKNYVAEVERLKNLQKTTANFNGTIKESIIYKKAFNNTMANSGQNAQTFVHGLQNGTESLNNMTKASKAAELGMKALSIAGNMALMFVLTEAIQLVYQFVTAQKQLQKAAAETGSAFAEKAKDIDEYKTKIAELQKTINDLIMLVNSYLQFKMRL